MVVVVVVVAAAAHPRDLTLIPTCLVSDDFAVMRWRWVSGMHPPTSEISKPYGPHLTSFGWMYLVYFDPHSNPAIYHPILA